MKWHSAANFERQIHVVNGFVKLAQELMDDLQVYVLFNSISVISERKLGDYERQYVMKPHLRLKRLQLERLTYWATGASDCRSEKWYHKNTFLFRFLFEADYILINYGLTKPVIFICEHRSLRVMG